MSSKLPFPSWSCAAPHCIERANYRIEINEDVFLTCCEKHKNVYIRMLPGVVKGFTTDFYVPSGWKSIRKGHLKVGAVRVGSVTDKAGEYGTG